MTDISSSFALHQFASVLIYQTTEDIELKDGRVIPKGYVNATQMCVSCGKRIDKWKDNKHTQALLDEYTEYKKATPNSGYPVLVAVDGSDYDYQGTWISYQLAMNLAQWLSPKFAVWANETLVHVITGDFEALTPEAKKAQAELQKIWSQMRTGVKESFWFIGDAIKAYYDLNPRAEKYPGQNYSEVFDKLNLGLFGKKAKQIKSELGITSGLNRDHFGTEALKRIDMIQRIAEPQIKTGKNPVDSVSFALSVMMYEVMDYRE